MSHHPCSCGHEFENADALLRHADITGHPVVLAKTQKARQDTHSIEWALVVLANKRAEQAHFENQLRKPQTIPFWARVKRLVGLAA